MDNNEKVTNTDKEVSHNAPLRNQESEGEWRAKFFEFGSPDTWADKGMCSVTIKKEVLLSINLRAIIITFM